MRKAFLITESRDGSRRHSVFLVPAKFFNIWKSRLFSPPTLACAYVFAARHYHRIKSVFVNAFQKSNQYDMDASHSQMQCIS